MLRRLHVLCSSVLLALATHGCSGAADEGASISDEALHSDATFAEHPAVWSETLDLAKVRSSLPFLEQSGLHLHLSVHPGDLGDDLAALIQDAAARGVEVRLWLLLDKADGYWPSARNAEKWAAFAHRAMDWVVARRLPSRWLIVDMEPAWHRFADFERAALDNDVAALIRAASDSVDAETFARAERVFGAVLEEAHRRHFLVMSTVFSLALDDFGDGDRTIERFFDSPWSHLAFDRFSFMTYRSLHDLGARPLGHLGIGPFTNYLVYSYAQSAKARFGDKAALDLGVIPSAAFQGGTGLANPQVLRDDISAAIAAGVDPGRIHLFSLEGMVESARPADWTEFPKSTPVPEFDPLTTIFRSLVSGVDYLFPNH